MITVGMTYDLRDDYRAQGFSDEQVEEFDSAETINAIEKAIQDNNFKTHRIGNIKALTAALAKGERWDIVFNICEGVRGLGREAQVPALLEAYEIPYVFSAPWTMVVTLDKALAKTVLEKEAIATAPWQVLNAESDIGAVNLPFPLFVKPLGEGSSVGIHAQSLVRTQKELENVTRDLLRRYRQPLLVEPFLSGREFTVGILGEKADARVIGVLESHLGVQDIRSLASKPLEPPEFHSLATDALAQKAGDLALAAWKAVQGRDGGRIDIRCDAEGRPFVLEINALPGLTPEYSDICRLAKHSGMDFHTLIGSILMEACGRYGLQGWGAGKKWQNAG